MRRRVSPKIRAFVAQRAGYRCEYCHIHESDTFYGCQVEHIISLKHGGTNDPDNLAYACAFCNYAKGTDIATVLDDADHPVRLFNPRRDRWEDHFTLEGAYIIPLTKVGEATVRLLGFNHPLRLAERELLIKTGRYQPPRKQDTPGL
ncbi:MAG: HNH endonuclease [Armatimonadetes bacterium]|nr:HNH endonuclease [Armatimonadota bacterium]